MPNVFQSIALIDLATKVKIITTEPSPIPPFSLVGDSNTQDQIIKEVSQLLDIEIKEIEDISCCCSSTSYLWAETKNLSRRER